MFFDVVLCNISSWLQVWEWNHCLKWISTHHPFFHIPFILLWLQSSASMNIASSTTKPKSDILFEVLDKVLLRNWRFVGLILFYSVFLVRAYFHSFSTSSMKNIIADPSVGWTMNIIYQSWCILGNIIMVQATEM